MINPVSSRTLFLTGQVKGIRLGWRLHLSTTYVQISLETFLFGFEAGPNSSTLQIKQFFHSQAIIPYGINLSEIDDPLLPSKGLPCSTTSREISC